MTTTVVPQANGADLIEKWDRGESCWTVEMGGLGPGYEQALQVAVVEIVRDNLGKRLPQRGHPDDAQALESWGNDTIGKHSDALGGLSGAQAGAARNLAYRILNDGYEATLESMRKHDKDRLIQVSKTWPRAAGET